MKNNFKKSNLVLVFFGTRPEIIKLFPIIKLLIENKIQHKLVFTGQHSSLYEDVKHLIPVPDYNFKIDYKKLPTMISGVILFNSNKQTLSPGA